MTGNQVLVSFGFTALESQIYTFLVGESPATGYRIAQGIGKPVANVYKALQSLTEKHAVVLDTADNKLVSPVPPEELLGRLTREFEAKKKEAQAAFADAAVASLKNQVQTYRQADALLAQAKQMVQSATHSVVLACTKFPLAELETELRQALTKGVSVTLKTKAAIRLDGGQIVSPIRDEDLWTQWPEEGLALAVDGQSFLFGALSSAGTLRFGMSTDCNLLALVAFQGLAADACISEIEEKIEEGAGAKRVSRTIGSMRQSTGTPGFSELKTEN